MENKISYYKTKEERLLKGVIDNLFNEYIGGNENAYMDGVEYHPYTEEELIDVIVNEILTCDTYLNIENSWEVLEPKHIRFIGKTRVKEIVEHRVNYRHIHEGKWEWERKVSA